jgi:flagellar biosynthesis protein FliR
MSALYCQPILTYVYVLARVGGLIAVAPLFSANFIPKQLRVMLALVLALVIAPTQLAAATSPPASLISLALIVAQELVVGLFLGLGTAVLLSGAQVAGQIVSQMSGLSLAEVYSPGADADLPLLSQLLFLTSLAVFLLIGGQRLLISALLETYSAVPIGSAALPRAVATLVPSVLAESFSLALRVAAPAMVALSLGTILLGLVGRTLPQANFWSLGFALNTAIAMLVLAVSVGAIAWLLQDQLEPAISSILKGFRAV